MTRVTPVKDESVREAMLKSMRTAAEKRLGGVTKNNRPRWYEQRSLARDRMRSRRYLRGFACLARRHPKKV